jgi:sulfate/thiosulfate transport system permease protein
MSKPRRLIPGFGLTMGYTVTYLTLLVLIPLGALVLRTARLSWGEFWEIATDPFVVASYKVTLRASIIAAAVNGVFGLLVAWVLVRYPLPGKRIFDALIDFPFALPTAVAGLTFSSLYLPNGWIGQVGRPLASVCNSLLAAVGADGRVAPDFLAFSGSQGGIVIVLIFVGLPFVVRTVQPVLQDWDAEYEQAAMSLGAGRLTVFRRVIFPEIMPAWLSGIALSFARAVGEYGSVIFIASNKPGESEITPLQIVTKLETSTRPGYPEATAVAVVLLTVSLLMLLLLNGLEWWSRRHERSTT